MDQFSLPTLGLHRLRLILLVSAMMFSTLAGVGHAQHDQAMSSPSAPSQAAVSPPVPLRFDSVLSRYKPMTDQKLGSWREANDTVARIGGWRSYLKESQTPDAEAPGAPRAPAVPAVAAPTTTNPHGGHGAKP
jgi:hypothetical protein